MPVRYRLDLDQGVHVYIRPKHEGGILALLTLFALVKSYGITIPVGTIWHALQQNPYTELSINLSPEDARVLYWGMPEGSRGIIYVSRDRDP